MAIVHVAMKSSSKAPPAAAHADYISREGSYAKRGGVELVESGNMPKFAQDDPRRFWEAADAYERANGRTYTELQIALPRELDPETRTQLAREATRELLGERYAYTLAIHSPLAKDNIEQPHMHLMFSERAVTEATREIPEEQFFKRNGAKKDPEWNDREKPGQVREQWCEMMNRAMERAHVPERVSPLSWAAQGRDDLAALVEPKQPYGNTIDAEVTAAQIAHLRIDRAELQPRSFDGESARQNIESQLAKTVADIERRGAEMLAKVDARIEQLKQQIRETVSTVAQKIPHLMDILTKPKPEPPRITVTAEEMRYVQLLKQVNANKQRLTPEEMAFFSQAHRKHGDNRQVLMWKVDQGAQVMQTHQTPQAIPENPWKALEAQIDKIMPLERLLDHIKQGIQEGASEPHMRQALLQWSLAAMAKHPQIGDYLDAKIEEAKGHQKTRGPEQEQNRDYGPER